MVYRGIVSLRDITRRIGHDVYTRGVKAIRDYLALMFSGLRLVWSFTILASAIVEKCSRSERELPSELGLVDELLREVESHLAYVDELMGMLRLNKRKLVKLLLRPSDEVSDALSNTFDKLSRTLELEDLLINKFTETVFGWCAFYAALRGVPGDVDGIVDEVFRDPKVVPHVDYIVRETYLASMLALLMVWAGMFEPMVSEVRYNIEPDDVKEDSLIVDTTRHFIEWMSKTEAVPVIRAFIIGDVGSYSKAEEVYKLLSSMLRDEVKMFLKASLKQRTQG